MKTNRNQTKRFLTLISTFACLVVLLLACGPAAPYQESQGDGLDRGIATDPPSRVGTQSDGESDTSDTTDPVPTKPPFPPTNTPFPTLSPDPPGVEEEIARHLAEERAARYAVGPSLAEQTTEFTRNDLGNKYDYIVRAEVKSHRVVPVNTDITWPDDSFSPPYLHDLDGDISPWRRSKLEVTTTYQGSVPEGYEIISPAFILNEALDVDQEYILFILAVITAEDDFPDQAVRPNYNAEQLEAIGGRGGMATSYHTWVIDGDTAWRLPIDHFISLDASSDLPAAKAAERACRLPT